MITYSLHKKTLIALAFHQDRLARPNMPRYTIEEELYAAALKSVAYNANRVIECYSLEQEWNKQNRVTVRLNREVNKILYMIAIRFDYEKVRDMTCFLTYEDGVDELIADMKHIYKINKAARTSISYKIDDRIIALRDKISKECKIRV